MQTQRQLLLALVVLALPACGDNVQGDPDASPVPDARWLPDADALAAPRAEPAACRFDVPSSLSLSEGTDYDCGDLTVFENRDAPARTIEVHYIRIRSGVSSANATIYLDGGPGGNGNNILAYIGYSGQGLLDGLLVDGDFLVISQRGTSLSVPALLCSESDCSDLSSIAHLPSYNTAYNADDVEDLRATLGYEKLNVYGIFYGSRLGLEVLRRHGAHVRAAVLGGMVPAQVVWPAEIPASFYSALTALNASCAAAGACGTAYGDLEAKFIAGVDALNDQPVTFGSEGDDIFLDGWTYASLLFQIMYSKSTYPWLPIMISDLAERRTDRVADFIGSSLMWSGDSSDLSTGLYYSVVCGELFNPPNESAFDTANAGVPAAIRDTYSWSWYGLLDGCQTWPVGEPRPTLSQPVTSDVRALLASGTMDPITPPSFGDIAATTLSDRVVVVFANSGHGSTLQTACGMQTFLGFLADPSATLDTSCAASITTEYVLPAAMTNSALPNAARLRFELGSARIPPEMRRLLQTAIRRGAD